MLTCASQSPDHACIPSCVLSAGVLTYIEASDSIVLRAAEVPEGYPTTDESAANGVPDPGETPVTDVIVM